MDAVVINTLSITLAGNGSGTVTSSPAGINCGADCSEQYSSGTVVTLTATPNTGSSFAGWSGGGCTGTGTCTLSMNADTTVTATFNLSTVALQGIVQGIVKDFLSGQVLNNVTLVFKDLNGVTISTTSTDINGTYSIQLPAGPVSGIASLQGYVTTTIDFEVIADTTTTVDIALLVQGTQFPTGDISGRIDDAVTGNPIDGALVEVRSGINNTEGAVVASALTDATGLYSFFDLPAGTYTAMASKTGYITNSFTVGVVGGQLTSEQNGALSPILAPEELRIVVTWGATPDDLDSHLTGPIPDQTTRFHVYFADQGNLTLSPFAALDRDDITSFGPETITITMRFDGIYRYSVHDFSNSLSSTSSDLSNSGAQVKIYMGSSPTPTIFNVPPGNPGTVWTVFELDGISGTITPINLFGFESDSGSITSFKPQSGKGSIEALEIFRNLPSKPYK